MHVAIATDGPNCHRPTQFSGAEIGSENCKFGICTLSWAPLRFGLLLYCRRFVQYIVRNREITLMQLWKCFTVLSLRSACLAMHQTTIKTKGRQLQRECKMLRSQWPQHDNPPRSLRRYVSQCNGTQEEIRDNHHKYKHQFTEKYTKPDRPIVSTVIIAWDIYYWLPHCRYDFLVQFSLLQKQDACRVRQRLVCSNIYNGAFCKWCVVFSPQTVSRSAKPSSSLVSGPHCNYKKVKEHYNNHQNCHYHKLCADRCRQIQRCTKGNAFNSSRQKAVVENRNRLYHIIRTIEFCGLQEIPLKGHRDAGAFSSNETDCNDGIFKAALRLRVEAANKQTSDLFLKALHNASYISWRVQNQIISLMGDAIQKQIVSDISQCKYFSILPDKTTDANQTEQLSLSVRFFNDNKVHAEFLCFVPVS